MPVQKGMVALCAVATILIVGWLLRYSAYGIDFTDESFYLVSIANPFIHDYSHTQFGFVIHPIYNLFDGDIARLRQANIIFTFGLAWGLIYVYLSCFSPETKNSKVVFLIITAALATSVFIKFDSWLLTPSYNSLAFQALIITAIGLVLSEKDAHKASLIGWTLIGFGGWLAFMAKPSTALALSFGVLTYLLLARKFSVRLLLFSVAISVSLLLLSATLIDGSVFEFSNRIKRAIDFGKILGSGHTLIEILRIDNFQLSEKAKILLILIGFSVFIFISTIYHRNKKWLMAGFFISVVFFAITVQQTLGFANWALGLGQFQALLIFSLVFAAAFAGIAFGKLNGLKSITGPQWAIACFFLVAPHIFAFGTNGNYWRAGGSAAIFWLCAGLVFLKPLILERTSLLLLLPIAIAAQSLTITLLQSGFEQPYRQPQSIKLNSTSLEFGAKKKSLILSNGYAEYISNAVLAAHRNGFEVGTPIIDLSGQSPGLLYALGAESIGQAWNVGGYPGSLNLAKVALSRANCEKISASWVLLEPGGPRSISNELMLSVGSAFPDGYARAAVWKSAAGAGGYSAPRIQELYKPIASVDVLNRCNGLRRNKNQG